MNALNVLPRFLLLIYTVGLLSVETVDAKVLRSWAFPIKRPHAGIPLGNGRQGVLVWGHDDSLKITISRQGFWDHQGGRDFTQGGTYAQLEKLVTAKDEAGLRTLFGPKSEQSVRSFQQLGGGRLTLVLKSGHRLYQAQLDAFGQLRIEVVNPKGRLMTISISHSQLDDCLVVSMAEPMIKSDLLQSAVSFCKQAYDQRNIARPDTTSRKTASGLIKLVHQLLPHDSGLVIGFHKSGLGHIYQISTALVAKGSVDWIQFDPTLKSETSDLKLSAERWRAYYNACPSLNLLGYPELQREFDYSLYMQAITQAANGLPSTLQGPLLEDNNLPPWSADYHWNINVQMLHWSNLITGQHQRQKPLWDFIRRQLPTMQRYGKHFFGHDGAIMLPHATDDRLNITGSFWAGHIDAACMAWLAQMSYEYYTYTRDETHLKEVVWPLSKGAYTSFSAMLRDTVVNGKPMLWLPVSVNPEWRGSQLRAAGPNASFQLAAVHALLKILPKIAFALNEPQDPRWNEVKAKLPLYTVINAPFSVEYDHFNWDRIALFTNQDLIESHRHHSHLASIYPFRTVSIEDTTRRNNVILKNSLVHWLRKGPGTWTGWSHIWASQICSYANRPQAGLFWLNQWQQGFLNEGGGSLHDAPFEGISVAFRDDAYQNQENGKPYREYMQLDARLGFIRAMIEVFVRLTDYDQVTVDLNAFKRSQLLSTTEYLKQVSLPDQATLNIEVSHPTPSRRDIKTAISGQLPRKGTFRIIVKGWPLKQPARLKIGNSVKTLQRTAAQDLIFDLPPQAASANNWTLE